MITTLLTTVAIFLVGMLIPQFLVRSVIGPAFRIFVVPGVILHELAHAFFCVVTGAKVRRIRVFRRDGGEVAHEQSKIPIVGPLLITMAPLLIGLIAIIWMAHRIAPSINTLAVGTSLHDFPSFFWGVIGRVQWGHFGTWVWLYLILSVGATLAPSLQDLKNSWFPIVLIIALALIILKTGMYRASFDQLALGILPALTIALFILLVIAAISFAVYLLSSGFGINR